MCSFTDTRRIFPVIHRGSGITRYADSKVTWEFNLRHNIPPPSASGRKRPQYGHEMVYESHQYQSRSHGHIGPACSEFSNASSIDQTHYILRKTGIIRHNVKDFRIFSRILPHTKGYSAAFKHIAWLYSKCTFCIQRNSSLNYFSVHDAKIMGPYGTLMLYSLAV